MALDYVAEWQAVTGQLAAAAALSAERREILAATGNPDRLGGAAALVLPAWGGSEADARSAAAAVTDASGPRGLGAGVVYAEWALAVLELGSGNYKAARAHALVVYEEDLPYMGTVVLPDLIEAAARSGYRRARPGRSSGWNSAPARVAPNWRRACWPGAGPCWPTTVRPRRCTGRQSTGSGARVPHSNWRGPTCCTGSGFAANAGGWTPASSFARLMRCCFR